MSDIDWKNSSDYPPVNSTSLHRWAAEFCKRNPNFIDDFEAAKKEQFSQNCKKSLGCNETPIGWSESPTGRVLRKYGVRYPVLPQWRNTIDTPLIFESYPRHCPTYFIEKPNDFFNESAVGKSYIITERLDDKLVLEFDLSQPLGAQLKIAKSILASSQKRLESPKRTKGVAATRLYPYYLRVLDAVIAGASNNDICDKLSIDYASGVSDDTLRNWIKEAQRLRDGGYKDIVFNHDPTR